MKKEAVIASIAGPLGELEEDDIAKYSGVIIGRTNLPIVNRGDALFHVARVDDLEEAESTIECRAEITSKHYPAGSSRPLRSRESSPEGCCNTSYYWQARQGQLMHSHATAQLSAL